MAISTRTRGSAAGFAAAIALAGCSSGGAQGAAPGGSQTPAAASTVEQLRAKLEAASAQPEFEATGGPIDISSLRGKTLFNVPLATTPENQAIGDAMRQVADETGIKMTSCENQGKSDQLSQCLDQALSTRQSVVVLHADPAGLGPQLQALKAAGIPVLSLHYFAEGTDIDDPACKGCPAGVTAVQPLPLAEPAELMADWVITQGGDVNALVPMITGLAPTVVMQASIESEFEKQCPACQYKILPISVADALGGAYQTSLSSALNADPKINYIISQTDFLLPATMAALKTTGRNDIKVTSRQGTPDALKLIAAGENLAMDVGEPAPWVGYAAMDNSFRLMLGKPTDPKSTPVRVWTADNVKEAGTPPTVTDGYGDAYVDGYRKLWGLS